ncbi:MAG: M48 family metalloprotease [bacterium]|nr:M48 family metalloprotease [bacterium]
MKKIIILLLGVTLFFNLQGQKKKNYTGWWLGKYGDYVKTGGKNDPRVKRAFAVFERVKNAADKSEARVPRLFIVAQKSKDPAMALPDGGIIIDRSVLDISYGSGERTEGDRRLAFILGHELAHLANDDFMHREAFLAVLESGDKNARIDFTKDFKLPEHRTKELMADKKGALFAAMAGYDIGKLFNKKNNFLKSWAAQTGIRYDDDRLTRHPSFKKRVRYIRPQLLAVARQVELFRAGVLLYQVGSFRDSGDALREFAKTYPAREVLNNIGACNLSLALQSLQLKFSGDYYRFRLSAVIDYATSAGEMRPRSDGNYLKDKDIFKYITKAENYFRRAAARDAHDRTCRYNLAATLILKKEYAEAQAVCNKLLNKNPHDVYALNNKAIAFYYYGKEEDVETTQNAIQMLLNANKRAPGNYEILYNLSALKQERKRLAGARIYWEKYLTLPTTPKDNFYFYVYRKLKGTDAPVPSLTAAAPKMPAGIRLGDNFSRIEKKWGKRHAVTFRLGSEEGEGVEGWLISLQTAIKARVRVIALDGTVEVVERELAADEDISIVLKRFGEPERVVRHSGGYFYVYESSGFSIKAVDNKACSYIWFEKQF